MDDHFKIATSLSVAGDGVTTFSVTLAGSLDLGSRDELRAALLGIVQAGGGGRIVVDLSRVRFIDSEAISALIQSYLAAERAGYSFRLIRAVGIVERVLTVVGLGYLLERP
ncbi:STAS domain-containing protein [Actinoplanes teichomyceticus]|uniref:Anti-anti-sigma factor n=1 Tax=Actinoplanes teichomyceticus TaxID=1867 RepID=A0A561VMQ7_ACTTI|nr:STAS domain-containing protein [Actinoplanes teichomyceticus]TWG12906.1 anti-anti-sigma factor [Actinoplanes teichomyceticus]